MRLICPNCSAQYEIDGSLIPDEGRDVQCSNCGKTWFELPQPPEEFSDIAAAPEPVEVQEPDYVGGTPEEDEPEAKATEASAEPVDVEPEPEPKEEPESEPEDDREGESQWDDEPPPDDEEPEEEEEEDDWNWPQSRLVTPAAAAPAAAAAPQRRAADHAAREILRQEAEQELAMRRAKPSAPLESQLDMGLEDRHDRDTPSRALRARMARLRSDEVSPKDSDDGYDAPRRDLLPDIEEINSSLNPSKRKSAESEAEKRSGFRLGFAAMIALAVVMVLAYTQAPAIASSLPGTENAMIAYVDWANSARDAISGLLGGG